MTSPPSTKRSSSPPSVVVAPSQSHEAATTNGSNAGVAAGANASTRAARPPARSNFDLEPNPFEHSFSSTSVVSHSSATDTPQKDDSTADGSHGNPKPQLNISNKATNGTDKKTTDDAKPVLPPLAAIESPAGQGFGSWGLSSSLRSGPLSPAMLAGPANQTTPSLSLAFDSSFVRTGLTPDVGRTGFTPLIAGGFPPPSPNTNALYQLVNGTTSGAPLSSSVAITPGTLSLLNGVLNSTLNSIHQPTAISLDTQNQQLIDGSMQPQQQQQYHQSEAYSSNENANHALSNAASALFLLSQQQNLQRQQNQAQNQGQVNPSAVSAPPPMPAAAPDSPTNVASRRATKRKSVDTPVPAPRGKKAKPVAATSISTRGSSRRKDSKMEEDDDDDLDDDEDDEGDEYFEGHLGLPSVAGANRSTGNANRGGQKKPETEEEKRRNFLERNRQAALKCRQRKKAWLQALQQKVEFLTTENERLAAALVTSREEITRLSQAVVAQGGAPSALLNQDPLANVRQNASPVMNGSSMEMTGAGAGARGSISSASSNANGGSQPVHISVPIPGLGNGVAPNAPMTNAMGHARTHSHGHAHVPPPQNSVTVGGRGYGY